jgi:hypothetical protein
LEGFAEVLFQAAAPGLPQERRHGHAETDGGAPNSRKSEVKKLV